MSCSLTGAVPDESKEDRQIREQQAWRTWLESSSSFRLLVCVLYGYVVFPLAVVMIYYGLAIGMDKAMEFGALVIVFIWIPLFCEKKFKGVFVELWRRCR